MSSYVRFGPLVPISSQDVSNVSNITSGCPDGIQWIWVVMADCAVSPREQASAYVGLVSMVTWMMVAIPQIIKNFINIDGMGGISFFLLFQWTAGDTTNLIGAILTNQLKPQIYLACFFVASDCLLQGQYLAFFLRRRARRRTELAAAGILNPPQVILCFMGLIVFSQCFLEQLFPSSWQPAIQGNGMVPGRLSRSLLSVNDAASSDPLFFTPEGERSGKLHSNPTFWHTPKDIIGYAIGVVSSIFYLGSRVSQIMKNYKSASTEGLAILTFILAVFGNMAYGGQILIQSLDGDFLLQHTPWLVGSLGVIALDCTLLVQFYHYNKQGHDQDEERQKLLNTDYDVSPEHPVLQ